MELNIDCILDDPVCVRGLGDEGHSSSFLHMMQQVLPAISSSLTTVNKEETDTCVTLETNWQST
jgi:hypothetical protein